MHFTSLLTVAFAAAAAAAPADHQGRTVTCSKFSRPTCGVKGSETPYLRSITAPYKTITDPKSIYGGPCGEICRNDWQCDTFSVGEKSCRLYKLSLKLVSVPKPSGSLTFNDKCCIVNEYPPTAPSPTPSPTRSPSASIPPPSSTPSVPSPTSTPAPTPPTTTSAPPPPPSSTSEAPLPPSTTSDAYPEPTATPPPGPPVCGTKGYDKQTPPALLVDSSGTRGTQETCSQLCRETATCQSYAFGSNLCLLYAAPVANNLLEVPDSPYAFYDLSC